MGAVDGGEGGGEGREVLVRGAVDAFPSHLMGCVLRGLRGLWGHFKK